MTMDEYMKVLEWQDEYNRLTFKDVKRISERSGMAIVTLGDWFAYKKKEEAVTAILEQERFITLDEAEAIYKNRVGGK